MANRETKVIAAVPAHNAAGTIKQLLKSLVNQGYDDIYVIDDASEDTTVRLAKSFSPKVKVLENSENVGTGANHNRIIGRVDDSIIHFIDADMILLTKNAPKVIKKMHWPKTAAYIGGIVRNPDGTQNPFNYGPRPHVLTGIPQGSLQFIIWRVGRLNRPLGKILRKLFAPLLKGLPDIYAQPRARRTHWVAESNMLVKSNFFAEHGGFDPRFRYSEISDLSLRAHRSGFHGYFTPELDAIHSSMDNVLKSRHKRLKAHKQFLEKHGRLVYYFPPLSDYLFTRKTQKRYHK
jgi:GT2 family glycosyltransferase